ncbi:hypothetical protein EYF80_014169 [Liparis tanakae]|uniref:Uncharacterized protein n=1 Tax=Liparis tanakae TaxID=230148 RepID=A0A4Z2IC52_9TELE|nr:hypothetical protein EYF80_014169 [Liparis tanakae]
MHVMSREWKEDMARSEAREELLIASILRTDTSTVTPFTLAKKANLTKVKVEELHRTVTKCVVKGLRSFSTLESPWFSLGPRQILRGTYYKCRPCSSSLGVDRFEPPPAPRISHFTRGFG